MAPNPLDVLDDRVKEVIQTLYAIQSCVHGYLGPETQQELVRKVTSLASQLQSLSAPPCTVSSLPHVPPEIIGYVDSSRNPDIYTREFVELVQKGNSYVRGKSGALAGFRDALAEEMIRELDGIEAGVLLATGGRSGIHEGGRRAEGRRSSSSTATLTSTGFKPKEKKHEGDGV